MNQNEIRFLQDTPSNQTSAKLNAAYQTGFSRGYHRGYQDGMLQVNRLGNPSEKEDILSHPIEALNLSPRAFHCLHLAGYVNLCDVAELDELQIIRIKGMGIKTLKEIARALREYGIGHTQWELLSMRAKL